MMRPKHVFMLSMLLPVFAAGNTHAQAAKSFRYLPLAAKTPRIPGVLNPKLPLATRIRLASLTPVLEAAVTRTVTTSTHTAPLTAATAFPTEHPPVQSEILPSCPERFAGFVQWLDQLIPQHLAVSAPDTRQAIGNIRQAVVQYDILPDADKPRINWLVISLNKLRPHLKALPDGSLQRLVYRGNLAEGELPQADHFELQSKRIGIQDPFFRPGQKTRLWKKSLALSRAPSDKSIIQGFTLFQGFTPQDTHEELAGALRALVPSGYQVRMGPKELGLMGENRTKFREGKLHLHIETTHPSLKQSVPVSQSTSLFISAKPFAGIIDVHTRQIILSNNDQTIARNYLILFEPYLNTQGRQALQAIIEENP